MAIPQKKRPTHSPSKKPTKQVLKKQISREDFIDAIQRLKLKVEKQPQDADILHSFVQIIDFNSISTPNTQIVYGRNGVGKTHLLKAYYQYCENSFEKNKILPVYIDFKELQIDPVIKSIAVDDLILRFYKYFLLKIIYHLEGFSKKVITINLLQRVFGGEGNNRKQKIDQSIASLISMLNQEQIEEKLKNYTKEVLIDNEGISETKSNIDFSGKLSSKKVEAQIGLGSNELVKEIEREKEKVLAIYEGLAVIDYEKIRDELETIIKQCGANAIILLIDEWSAVNVKIQPLLAEMIRKTIAISNKIFLKIVALKYFTRTSALVDPPQRIGFQMGIDITQLADLDDLLNFEIDKQGVKDFLTFIAFKHLCLEIPKLEKFSVKEFENFLCNELFENQDTYFELIRSTEGNPRDFLTILCSCCIAAKADSKSGIIKKISNEKVVRTAAHYFIMSKAPEVKNNIEAYTLFKEIYSYVTSKGKKFFLISTDRAENDSRIKELWHYRFIHLINPSYLHFVKGKKVREYAVYSIDYGKLLSLKIYQAGDKFVTNILGSLDLAMKIFTPMVSFMGLKLPKFADNSQFGGSLKKIKEKFGTVLVDEVEVGEIKDINFLIDNCCIDELL